MQASAILSDCRQYRYLLERTWDNSLPKIAFIGLNPSTADEKEDDPTLRRCIRFAQTWAYGGLYIANLFAYRTKSPKILLQSFEPIGPKNDQYLGLLSDKAKTIVFAWGNHGTFLNRDQQIKALFPKAYCLAKNKSGQPKHPLYCKADTQLIRYGS